MQRVLMIAPHFAPRARIGAKRPLKFVRHLRKFGWEPVVLSLPPGSKHGVDQELLELLPEDLIWYQDYASSLTWKIEQWMDAQRYLWRGRSENVEKWKGPTNPISQGIFALAMGLNEVFIPAGPRVIHLANAAQKAVELIRKHDCRAIWVCADPNSVLAVGAIAKRLTGCPLCIDMRGVWMVDKLQKKRTRFVLTGELDRRIERWSMEAADSVSLNTEISRDTYRSAYADFDPQKFSYVRNCFDPGIFKPTTKPSLKEVARAKSCFSVVFFGNVTYISPEYFLRPYADFIKKRGLSPEDTEFVIHGKLIAKYRKECQRLGIDKHVQVKTFVPYRASLDVLTKASVLLICLSPGRTTTIPGKFYDCLAAERPILNISDNTELNKYIEETNTGVSFSPTAHDQIVSGLEDLYDKWKSGELGLDVDKRAVRQFTAEETTKKLALILDEISD